MATINDDLMKLNASMVEEVARQEDWLVEMNNDIEMKKEDLQEQVLKMAAIHNDIMKTFASMMTEVAKQDYRLMEMTNEWGWQKFMMI